MMLLLHYLTADGRDPYQAWLNNLRDLRAQITIDRRIERLKCGNFGDHKFCREGVWELRIDVGSGYRVYYAQSEQDIVLLLCGGDKNSQRSDINKAINYWHDWQKRD